ncbi:hypothetical protein MANES_08G004105v8 [Manihot esculenta]|uniref:Uncharacterized protein n=1 Tax=Manihot esculenta TaxID=3983 RepID=A0ACB7H8J1_MANES|nr:hypothetical protein MANES_08G004105v8 [Manihot esculenta]
MGHRHLFSTSQMFEGEQDQLVVKYLRKHTSYFPHLPLHFLALHLHLCCQILVQLLMNPHGFCSLLTPTLKNITHLRHESKVHFGGRVALFKCWQNRVFRTHLQKHLILLGWVLACLERLTLTCPMQVTFGEEGSWVSLAPFFFLTNIGLERDLPLLLLLTLLLKNLINGGG